MEPIDLSKLKAPVFTARQLSLVTQAAQAVGLALVGKGLVSEGDWELYAGLAVSLFSLWLGWNDGGKNDAGTVAFQGLVGTKLDAKPGPETFAASVERLRE